MVFQAPPNPFWDSIIPCSGCGSAALHQKHPSQSWLLLAALYSSASSALASLAFPGQVIPFLSPPGQTKPFWLSADLLTGAKPKVFQKSKSTNCKLNKRILLTRDSLSQ